MVGRELAVFSLVTVGLVAVGAACGGISLGSGQGAPETPAQARATDVRRTAVAEAQRIIANPPPATPTIAPIPMPRPDCPNAIWWHEARSHFGEVRTVEGPILATRRGPDGSVLLELGRPYPDPMGVAVLLPGNAQAPQVSGKTVCVAGRISTVEGRATMQLRDASAIALVN